MVQWCLSLSLSLLFTLHHSSPLLSFLPFIFYFSSSSSLTSPRPLPSPILPILSSPSLFLDLEDKQAQVDVFGGQQFVALHRVGDGEGHVVGLVAVVAEGVVVDDRRDPHVLVRPFQQQEGALQGRVHLRTEQVCEATVVRLWSRSRIGAQKEAFTSKAGTFFFLEVGTFWLLRTTLKDCLGVKTKVRIGFRFRFRSLGTEPYR